MPRFRELADGSLIYHQDDDPILISPHQRFERALRTPGAIDTYENTVRKFAKPVRVTLAEHGLYGWKIVTESLYRISNFYRVPFDKVKDDISKEGNRQLSDAVLDAALEGRLLRQLDDGSYERLSREEGLAMLSGHAIRRQLM